MVRHPPRYKRTDTRFPTRRSCDLKGANMMTDPTMEALAAQLEASGDYRVLRRLPVPAGGFVPMPHMKRAVFLDVETTGLDPNVDDIIELAKVPLWYGDSGRKAGVEIGGSALPQHIGRTEGGEQG